MLIAHYVGDHAKDSLGVRLGWALTRRVQKGQFAHVTHSEAILHSYGGGLADIGSSSVRDGGVRIKERVQLDRNSWIVADMPMWDAAKSELWFMEHDGAEYDWHGAWATVMPGHHRSHHYFCNEAVGESVGLLSAHAFTPAQFAALCFSFGTHATTQFFDSEL